VLLADLLALVTTATLIAQRSPVALVLALAYAAGSFLALACSGEYGHRFTVPSLAGLPHLLSRLAVPLFLLAIVSPVVDIDQGALFQAPLSAAALAAGRAFVAGWIRRERRHGRLLCDTVVVGAGPVGVGLASFLEQHPEHGLRPVGVVDDLPSCHPAVDDSLPLLGVVSDLRHILAEHGVRHVIVAFGRSADERLVKILRSAVLDDVEVLVVPRFFEVGFAQAGASVDAAMGIPLRHLRRRATANRAFRAKRLLDVTVASLALLVLAPLLGLIAVAVRLTSPGPVLFRQRRIGQHGRAFDMLKFRTMRVNGDSDRTWSVSDDDRRTLVGRLLRPLSLDELPQLWNVLVGEMALVGPRPERPHFVDQFNPTIRGYEDRHRLPVGLTGLAQVHGLRGDTSVEQRARLDNYYIEHWSPWQDLAILASTAGEVWRNARSELGRSFGTRVSRRAARVESLPVVSPTPAEVADGG
jgi:exopolysaccharide biosynthesis polyprenyl glycosylphosphotransferase